MSANFTPREIVSELDRYIVGQQDAKRAVAIALRNRWRRQRVEGELKDEITPKNIIMIGPTGVGKTEIARRLARLAGAPFVKVEASKFTEVGYVGRDVESMVRDLVEASVGLVRQEEEQRVGSRAEERAEERLLDVLLPRPRPKQEGMGFEVRDPGSSGGIPLGAPGQDISRVEPEDEGKDESREKMRALLRKGTLDEREVEIEIPERPTMPSMQVFGAQGMEEMMMNMQDLFQSMPGLGGKKKTRRRKVTVAEARKLLSDQEAAQLVDMEKVKIEALERAESSGIIFLDEIDKVSGRQGEHTGPDISREGVQRDLLPVIEGSTVTTKYGAIRTDHVLFIAAGAFHVGKVSDMIPELQGRFPIRVELDPLSREDLVRILEEPRNSLCKQYAALMGTEDVDVSFTREGIEEIARIAEETNAAGENIGARRLHTVMERLLDDVSFRASELSGSKLEVDAEYVSGQLSEVLASEDLSRYIL